MAKFNFSNVLGGAVFGSLNAFLQQGASKDGYAKANRYEVVINLPTGAPSTGELAGDDATQAGVRQLLSGETARRISFRCDSISIPGRNLRTQMNSNIYGPPHEVVQGVTYAEVQATFYAGSDLAERYFFEQWQKVTYNTRTHNINYYKEYVGSVDIFQLNEQDERMYGVRLEEAFPKTIGEIAYGHGSNNTINKVTVSFSYRKFRNLASEGDLGGERKTLEDNLTDIFKNTIRTQLLSRVPPVLRRLF